MGALGGIAVERFQSQDLPHVGTGHRYIVTFFIPCHKPCVVSSPKNPSLTSLSPFQPAISSPQAINHSIQFETRKSTSERREGTKLRHTHRPSNVGIHRSQRSHHSLSKQAPTISQGIITKEEPDLSIKILSVFDGKAASKQSTLR